MFNPGEPVFDQLTGEPLIDEDGAFVEVSPGLRVTANGREYDADDVSSAAYYRANMFEGEAIRDRSIGVPYLRVALGQQDPALAAEVVVAEVRRRTPGIAGVVGVIVDGLDRITRVLRMRARYVKQARAGEVDATLNVNG